MKFFTGVDDNHSVTLNIKNDFQKSNVKDNGVIMVKSLSLCRKIK